MQDGSEVWTSIWGNKEVASAILVYDSKTLEQKAIEDQELKHLLVSLMLQTL